MRRLPVVLCTKNEENIIPPPRCAIIKVRGMNLLEDGDDLLPAGGERSRKEFEEEALERLELLQVRILDLQRKMSMLSTMKRHHPPTHTTAGDVVPSSKRSPVKRTNPTCLLVGSQPTPPRAPEGKPTWVSSTPKGAGGLEGRDADRSGDAVRAAKAALRAPRDLHNTSLSSVASSSPSLSNNRGGSSRKQHLSNSRQRAELGDPYVLPPAMISSDDVGAIASMEVELMIDALMAARAAADIMASSAHDATRPTSRGEGLFGETASSMMTLPSEVSTVNHHAGNAHAGNAHAGNDQDIKSRGGDDQSIERGSSAASSVDLVVEDGGV